MSPAKLDKCVTSVKKSIKKEKTRRAYINKEGKRIKTNPYAICSKKDL